MRHPLTSGFDGNNGGINNNADTRLLEQSLHTLQEHRPPPATHFIIAGGETVMDDAGARLFSSELKTRITFNHNNMTED